MNILDKLHMDVVLPSSRRVYERMQIEGGNIRDFILADVLPKLQWPSLEFVQSVWQCYEENGGEEEAKRAMFAASATSAWNKSREEPKKENPAEKIYYGYNNLEYFMGTFAIARKRLLERTWSEPSVGLIVIEKSGNASGMILDQSGLFVSFDPSKDIPHALDYWEPNWARLWPELDKRDDGASWFRNHERLQMALYKAFNCVATIGLDKFRADMATIANHMASQAQVSVIPAT